MCCGAIWQMQCLGHTATRDWRLGHPPELQWCIDRRQSGRVQRRAWRWLMSSMNWRELYRLSIVAGGNGAAGELRRCCLAAVAASDKGALRLATRDLGLSLFALCESLDEHGVPVTSIDSERDSAASGFSDTAPFAGPVHSHLLHR